MTGERRSEMPGPERSKVSGLHHVALPFPGTAEAFEDARHFYGGLLGLAEHAVPGSLSGVIWFDAGGDTELHLFAETVPPGPRSHRHPCLRVAGLGMLRDRLRAADVELVEPAEDIPGRRRLFAFDPFGNALEFLELDPTEPV